jgi:hypothetical protein
MKDAYDILKQKEADLARVRHEVESLRIVGPLLDDLDSHQSDKTDLISEEKTEDHLIDDLLNIVRDEHPDLKATGTDGLFSSITTSRSGLWNRLKTY